MATGIYTLHHKILQVTTYSQVEYEGSQYHLLLPTADGVGQRAKFGSQESALLCYLSSPELLVECVAPGSLHTTQQHFHEVSTRTTII